MTAGKLPSSLPSLIPCGSVKISLLSLATLTLIFVTYISFKSLHFPLQNTSSVSDLSPFPPIFHVAATTTKKPDLEELSDIYHSSEVFRLNYAEMEENFNFKVYIYPNGDPNTFYQTPRKLTGKYASEGYFFQNTRGPKIQILLTSSSSPFPVTKCVERGGSPPCARKLKKMVSTDATTERVIGKGCDQLYKKEMAVEVHAKQREREEGGGPRKKKDVSDGEEKYYGERKGNKRWSRNSRMLGPMPDKCRASLILPENGYYIYSDAISTVPGSTRHNTRHRSSTRKMDRHT